MSAAMSETAASIARTELAAIYSQTVPEHHGGKAPQPDYITGWERRRLIDAARHLREIN